MFCSKSIFVNFVQAVDIVTVKDLLITILEMFRLQLRELLLFSCGMTRSGWMKLASKLSTVTLIGEDLSVGSLLLKL